MRPKPLRNGRRTSSTASPPGDLRRRVQSLLGFAVKAGRVTPGFELTRKGLASGEVGFVLAARDLPTRRLEALTRSARERGVTVLVDWTRVELGSLLDRGPTGVVGVTDRSLARGMKACVGGGSARA